MELQRIAMNIPFKPGQKIKCVRQDFHNKLKLNQIYTVEYCYYDNDERVYRIKLVDTEGGYANDWLASRFVKDGPWNYKG